MITGAMFRTWLLLTLALSCPGTCCMGFRAQDQARPPTAEELPGFQVVVMASADGGVPAATLVTLGELPAFEAAHPERSFLIDDPVRAQQQLRELLHEEYGDFEPAILDVVPADGAQRVTLEWQDNDDSPRLWLRWRATKERVEAFELKKVSFSAMYMLMRGLESYGLVFLVCGTICAAVVLAMSRLFPPQTPVRARAVDGCDPRRCGADHGDDVALPPQRHFQTHSRMSWKHGGPIDARAVESALSVELASALGEPLAQA